MGFVIGTRAIKQTAIRLPVEPAIIERPIGVTEEAVTIWTTTGEQRVAHSACVEPRRSLHYTRITPCNVFMA